MAPANFRLNQGYYCTLGSIFQQNAPCPAGRFGSESGLTNSSCDGLCAAGRYGNIGAQLSNQCVGPCQSGFYCPPGSTSSQQVPWCAVCVVRFSIPVISAPLATTVHNKVHCRPFAHLVQKIFVQPACVVHDDLCAGVYGSGPQLQTAACSGLCSPGHYCPAGSTSVNQVDCPAGCALCLCVCR